MISIDNAVELMMKTYLGLPKRITGLAISRKEFQDAVESFPSLLDALEKYGADKLDGVDLGAIEWYHRLRNELYHQGNGLTVERDKIEIYSEIANILFKNLFGYSLVNNPSRSTEILGEFLIEWAHLESAIQAQIDRWYRDLGQDRGNRRLGVLEWLRVAQTTRRLDEHEIDEINQLRHIRNLASHGQPGWESSVTPEAVAKLQQWVKRLSPQRED